MLRNGKQRTNEISSVHFPTPEGGNPSVSQSAGRSRDSSPLSSDHGLLPATPRGADDIMNTASHDDDLGPDVPDTVDASVPKRPRRVRVNVDGQTHPVIRDRTRSDASIASQSKLSGPKIFRKGFDDETSGPDEDDTDDVVPDDNAIRAAIASMSVEEKAKLAKRARVIAKHNRKASATGTSNADQDARNAADSSFETDTQAGPSYFEKGKMRAVDAEGTDVAQLDRDREVAKALEREWNAENPWPGEYTARSGGRGSARTLAPARTDTRNAKRSDWLSKSALELNRFIETDNQRPDRRERASKTPSSSGRTSHSAQGHLSLERTQWLEG